jgi:hypothetical protein
MMSRIPALVLLVLLPAALAGCGQVGMSKLLGTSASTPGQAGTSQDLAMPPDLQLQAPSTVQQPAYVPPAAPATTTTTAATTTTGSAPTTLYGGTTAPANPPDIYAQYGISKYRADGTLKSKGELSAELKQAMIAKKRQANPNYGTIWNVGNIFSGE